VSVTSQKVQCVRHTSFALSVLNEQTDEWFHTQHMHECVNHTERLLTLSVSCTS